MNEEKVREEFEEWYASNTFNLKHYPIGSKDCGLQWKSWKAACASKQKEIDSLQAKIDALMLEYCPNEMTDEQVATWELNQRTVKENQND